MTQIRSGDVVGARYRLERQIGEGGMAAVWRATDQTLERPVAVKFLFARDERQREAMAAEFLREAKLAAAVRHRNVVQILDFGTHGDGVPFMVMELLEGDTLGDRFDRGEMFELREIIELLARALQGLAAVHDAGIVHRDLKPENIFLVDDRDGPYPKLLDFGISKSMDPEHGRPSAVTTRAGKVIGTPEYMSPEQARGLSDVDKRTDIYSMGVVVYEALAGQAPFESENTGDLLVMVIHGQAQPLAQIVPEVGWELSGVVEKAMHRDRQQRYADAMEFQRALLDALGKKKAVSLPPARARHRTSRTQERTLDAGMVAAALPMLRDEQLAMPRIIDRRPMLYLALGLAVLVAAGVVLFGGQSARDETPRYIVVQGSEASAAADRPSSTDKPAESEPPPALEEQPPREANGSEGAEVASEHTARAPQPETDTAQPSLAAIDKPQPAKATPASKLRAPTGLVQALTKAFNQQKRGVARCFDEHPHALSRNVTVSVRVVLDPDGTVRRAAVSPADIATSTLGDCVRGAVQDMRFGSQSEAVAFRVPLTARRHR